MLYCRRHTRVGGKGLCSWPPQINTHQDSDELVATLFTIQFFNAEDFVFSLTSPTLMGQYYGYRTWLGRPCLLPRLLMVVMVPCDLSTTCLYMVLILCVFSHIPRSLFNARNEPPQFDRSNHDVEHTSFATIGCNILRKRHNGKC